jgi:type I restriction enzyme S subunit
MKDSGVEWLGEVPAHWRVVRNKAVFAELDVRSETGDGELLSVSHLTGVTRRSEKNVNMIMAESLEGYKCCSPGDLVINTMWGWMGALGVSFLHGLVSPSYNVYRPRNAGLISPEYYDLLCRTPQHVIEIKANSTGIWESRLRLYPDAFLDMRMPLPPIDEQNGIAAHLQDVTGRFDPLVSAAEAAIALLQERRAALISAAVTGKIDVREVVKTDAVMPDVVAA